MISTCCQWAAAHLQQAKRCRTLAPPAARGPRRRVQLVQLQRPTFPGNVLAPGSNVCGLLLGTVDRECLHAACPQSDCALQRTHADNGSCVWQTARRANQSGHSLSTTGHEPTRYHCDRRCGRHAAGFTLLPPFASLQCASRPSACGRHVSELGAAQISPDTKLRSVCHLSVINLIYPGNIYAADT